MAGISVYTFNTNQNVQTHRHSHGHIIITLENEFYFRFFDADHYVSPKEIAFIPPDVEHDYSCSGRALTLNIPAEMVKAVDLVFLTEHCVREISEELQPLISLIKQEVRTNGPQNDSLRYLFYYLYDKLVDDNQMRAVRYIREHYAEDISIAGLAEMENYNPSYFAALFKQEVGYIPSDYIRMVRMEKAKEILQTTRYRIIDVAMQVGYTNASSFTRMFRETTGMTPNQFRRLQKGQGTKQ